MLHTGHANFDFKFNMYRMLFLLALKKVQMVKNTPFHIPTTQQRILFAKFFIAPFGDKALPLNLISKLMNFPFAQKEDFWRKLTNISITFVCCFPAC